MTTGVVFQVLIVGRHRRWSAEIGRRGSTRSWSRGGSCGSCGDWSDDIGEFLLKTRSKCRYPSGVRERAQIWEKYLDIWHMSEARDDLIELTMIPIDDKSRESLDTLQIDIEDFAE